MGSEGVCGTIPRERQTPRDGMGVVLGIDRTQMRRCAPESIAIQVAVERTKSNRFRTAWAGVEEKGGGGLRVTITPKEIM